jgi:hypothetical protein
MDGRREGCGLRVPFSGHLHERNEPFAVLYGLRPFVVVQALDSVLEREAQKVKLLLAVVHPISAHVMFSSVVLDMVYHLKHGEDEKPDTIKAMHEAFMAQCFGGSRLCCHLPNPKSLACVTGFFLPQIEHSPSCHVA